MKQLFSDSYVSVMNLISSKKGFVKLFFYVNTEATIKIEVIDRVLKGGNYYSLKLNYIMLIRS